MNFIFMKHILNFSHTVCSLLACLLTLACSFRIQFFLRPIALVYNRVFTVQKQANISIRPITPLYTLLLASVSCKRTIRRHFSSGILTIFSAWRCIMRRSLLLLGRLARNLLFVCGIRRPRRQSLFHQIWYSGCTSFYRQFSSLFLSLYIHVNNYHLKL